ncbi:MAG: translation elongation factor Ts, partial [Oscillospiraceae bacterium]
FNIDELLREKILTIGENIQIRRFVVKEKGVVSYIHGGGTHAVLVKFVTDSSVESKDEFITLGKDIAMHIAACNPLYLNEKEVPADVVEKEKEILTTQAMSEGKPAAIAEKMVIGRIKKFFKDICLLDQPFVKNQDFTIAQHVEEVSKKLGTKIELESFVRYEIGEGIEKKEDNFADEVANMVK